MASRITSCAVIGEPFALFSSIRRVASSWSSEPQLTPIRTALPWRAAISTMSLKWRSRLARTPTLPGLNAILGERLGAGREVGEQPMADEMKVADQRHVDADPIEPLADAWHGGSALVTVDGDGARAPNRPAQAPSPAPLWRRRRRCPCWSWTARPPAHRHRWSPCRRRREPERRRGAGPKELSMQSSIVAVASGRGAAFHPTGRQRKDRESPEQRPTA